MNIIIKITLIITLLFSLQNITYSADATNVEFENISIKTGEDARLAYSVALYYRDAAISKLSKNEDGKDDIERSNNILKDILEFEMIEEVYNTLSENYELVGDYKNSIETLNNALKENVYNVDILTKIAQKYFFIFEDYSKAEYYAKKAFELEPYNNDVLILLGYISYDRDKDYIKTCFYFSKVDESKDINSEFTSINYNIYYSLAAFYNGMYSLARERMLKADAKQLGSTYYNVITKSYQILEEYEKAYKAILDIYDELQDEESLYYAALLSVILDKYDENLFERINKSKRTIPRVIEIASLANGKDNNNKKAIKDIEKELESGNFDLDIMQLYYSLTLREGSKEEIFEAKKLLTDFYLTLLSYESMMIHLYSIAEQSEDTDRSVVISMYIKVINGFYINNNFEKTKTALDEYIKVLKKYSIKDSKYYMPAIDIAYNIKEYDTAIAIIDTITSFEDESNKSKYDYIRAYVYSIQKNQEETIYYINNYIDYASSMSLNQINFLYSSAYNIENKELALKVANMLYSSYNTYSHTINSLAWTLIYFDDDIDKGINLVKQALKDDTTNIYYLDTLGWGYYKKGQYEDALRIFLNLLFRSNEYSGEAKIEIFLHTADTYYAMGNKEEAFEYYLKTRAAMFEETSNYRDYVEGKIKELQK